MFRTQTRNLASDPHKLNHINMYMNNLYVKSDDWISGRFCEITQKVIWGFQKLFPCWILLRI